MPLNNLRNFMSYTYDSLMSDYLNHVLYYYLWLSYKCRPFDLINVMYCFMQNDPLPTSHIHFQIQTVTQRAVHQIQLRPCCFMLGVRFPCGCRKIQTYLMHGEVVTPFRLLVRSLRITNMHFKARNNGGFRVFKHEAY